MLPRGIPERPLAWRLRRARKHRRGPHGPAQSALLSVLAHRAPRVYLASILVLALLGHAWLLAFPVLGLVFAALGSVSLLAGAWLRGLLFLVGAAALGYVAWRLTQVHPAPPVSRAPSPRSAPRLYHLIERTRSVCQAPELQQIGICEDFSVRVIATPRSLYPFSFTRTLLIGLPTLQLLSPLHFRALLTRSLGQSSGRRNRLSGWIRTQRQVWAGVLRACDSWRRPELALARVFFGWYTPLFTRWSLPAACMDELRADDYMMDEISDKDVAELFSALVVAERYLQERYFPALFDLARRKPHPPFAPYSDLNRRFNRYWSDDEARAWVGEAYAAGTDRGSRLLTPPLRARLENIGHQHPRMPSPLRQAASRELLGKALEQVLREQDRTWLARSMPRWRDQHRAAMRNYQRLRALQTKARKKRLGAGEARELAGLVERCFGKQSAAPFYKQLLTQHPNDANISFAAGRFLLSANDPQGLSALRKAMALDRRFTEPASALINNFETSRAVVRSSRGVMVQ